MESDLSVPTTRLMLNKSTRRFCAQPKSEPFLKGPIPIAWLSRAARLPGKALNVALAMRWLSDMNADAPIKLTRVAMDKFHFSADAASDALLRMEDAGLIKLHKNPGQRHLIEVLSGNKDK